MGLTLTTHDTGFDDPDDATIAKVLGSLDGGRNVLVTLGESEVTYLETTGSVHTGFGLDYQEGSLDRHYRSRSQTLPLGLVTDIFRKYARGDHSWREGVEWEKVSFKQPKGSWSETWIGLAVIFLLVTALIWIWRGP